MKASQNYNVRWQAKVDEKLKNIVANLNKLNGRMWKLIFSLLVILGGLSVTLIAALMKIVQ